MAATDDKPQWWDQAKRELSAADPVMAALIESSPDVHLICRGDPFETLLRSVVGQQISVKAAANIWNRFAAACPNLDPEVIRRKHRKTLRAAGLSERKTDFIYDICRYFSERQDVVNHFEEFSDEELIKELCTIKGIGRWTAEMFLIFALRRPNVSPLLDYGFVKAIGRAYFAGEEFDSLSASERQNKILPVVQRWEPWKTAATWYLWRSLNNAPVQY